MQFHTPAGSLPAAAAEQTLGEFTPLQGQMLTALAHRMRVLEAKQSQMIRGLSLPDIIKREALCVEPGELSLRLVPTPAFPYRSRERWLDVCWRTLGESLTQSFDFFASPRIELRRTALALPQPLEKLRQYLLSQGAVDFRACRVTIDFESLHQTRLFMFVTVGDERFGRGVVDHERRLSTLTKVPVQISLYDLHSHSLQERVADGILDNPLCRLPRCFGEHDDPKPKPHRRPLNLGQLEWVGVDPREDSRAEDLVTYRETPLGGFVAVAFPLLHGGRAFTRRATRCPAIFCGGIPQADGSIARMRLAVVATSRPTFLTVGDMQSPQNVPAVWPGLSSSLALFSGYPSQNGVVLNAGQVVQAAMRFGQHVLSACLRERRTTASFIVRPLGEQAARLLVVPGDAIDPVRHAVDLKMLHRSSEAAARFNQLQLIRVMRGQQEMPYDDAAGIVTTYLRSSGRSDVEL